MLAYGRVFFLESWNLLDLAIIFIDVKQAFPRLKRALLYDEPMNDERLFQQLMNTDVPADLAIKVIEQLKQEAAFAG